MVQTMISKTHCDKLICLILILLFLASSLVTITIPARHSVTRDEIRNQGLSIPDWYEKPSTYMELVGWYLSLEDLFPGFLDVFKANELYQTGIVDGGYDLYYVRLTNESREMAKPEVLFIGSPHGDETVGTIGLYWFTHWMIRKACTDEPCETYSKEWLAWLLDHREIYIVISQNPFGFDMMQRYDANGWDLNREADYDAPGEPTGGIWGSVNGRTLRAFIDDHLIRVGCDFHGGARMILYPWSSTYDELIMQSMISPYSYTHVPPDFHFFDVSSQRLASFMGSYGGRLDGESIGPIPDTVGYEARGCLAAWAYGANIECCPAEDSFVRDEQYGNYPGSGILWLSPEMSRTKNPRGQSFGNDTIHRFGAEVRRFILHQTDLAQPSVRWMNGEWKQDMVLSVNESVCFQWQVNGSLMVDQTMLNWTWSNETDQQQQQSVNKADPINSYQGGTGWDNAYGGKTDGIIYEHSVVFNRSGEYEIKAQAMVDQIYKDTVFSSVYGNNSYLRLIKERVDDSFVEQRIGSDGVESINGSRWWKSSVVHITVVDESNAPIKCTHPENALYVNDEKKAELFWLNHPLVFGPITIQIDSSIDSSLITNVSFFVQNQRVHVDNQSPYSFWFDEPCFGLSTVRVELYGSSELIGSESVKLWKFW